VAEAVSSRHLTEQAAFDFRSVHVGFWAEHVAEGQSQFQCYSTTAAYAFIHVITDAT
jgi:hypothetical protein